MTPQEKKDLEMALEQARAEHHFEFERWYDTAAITSVAINCETGWLLWRYVLAEAPPQARQIEASVNIEGKGGTQA